MSARLSPVPCKRVINALERQGWYVKRIRGSHHVMRPPTIPDAIPVLVHAGRPVPVSTLRNIIRTAGLTRNEFIQLLK